MHELEQLLHLRVLPSGRVCEQGLGQLAAGSCPPEPVLQSGFLQGHGAGRPVLQPRDSEGCGCHSF